MNEKGSVVYKAVVDGEMVGGAVMVIDEKTQHNHLDFLYVKNGIYHHHKLQETDLNEYIYNLSLYY